MAAERISDFCELVCSQIGYRKVHREITEELTAHLEDKIDFLTRQGMDQQSALRQAIQEMGDPYEIGRQLSREHKPYWDYAARFAETFAAVLLGIFLSQVGTDAVRYWGSPEDYDIAQQKNPEWAENVSHRKIWNVYRTETLGDVEIQLLQAEQSIERDGTKRLVLFYSFPEENFWNQVSYQLPGGLGLKDGGDQYLEYTFSRGSVGTHKVDFLIWSGIDHSVKEVSFELGQTTIRIPLEEGDWICLPELETNE